MADAGASHLESQRPYHPVTATGEHAEIRDVLFPTDLSPESDRALEHAALIAGRFGAKLTVFHALQVAASGAHTEPGSPEFEALRRADVAAREHLEPRIAPLRFESKVLIEPHASIGRALVRLIAAHNPDLTVMATHGRDGLKNLLLGSVAETVVQYGRSPVMCVREPDHGVALPYRRILVPTDMSRASRRAFPIAALLTQTFGAEVVAVHVTREPHLATGMSGIAETVEHEVPTEDALRDFLDPEFVGLKVLPRVFIGHAWDRITQVARDERADLIVMSTHGRDSLADRVIGSHAERVMRHAPCPVLVV